MLNFHLKNICFIKQYYPPPSSFLKNGHKWRDNIVEFHWFLSAKNIVDLKIKNLDPQNGLFFRRWVNFFWEDPLGSSNHPSIIVGFLNFESIIWPVRNIYGFAGWSPAAHCCLKSLSLPENEQKSRFLDKIRPGRAGIHFLM